MRTKNLDLVEALRLAVAIRAWSRFGIGVICKSLGHDRDFTPEGFMRNKIPSTSAIVFVVVPGADAEVSGDDEEAHEEESPVSIFRDIVGVILVVPVVGTMVILIIIVVTVM